MRPRRWLEPTVEVARAIRDGASELSPYVQIADIPRTMLRVFACESDFDANAANVHGFSGLWQCHKNRGTGVLYADSVPDPVAQIRGAVRFWLANIRHKARIAPVNTIGRFYALNFCPGRLQQFPNPRVAYATHGPIYDPDDTDLAMQLVRCRWPAGYEANSKLDPAGKRWISINEDLALALEKAEARNQKRFDRLMRAVWTVDRPESQQ